MWPWRRRLGLSQRSSSNLQSGHVDQHLHLRWQRALTDYSHVPVHGRYCILHGYLVGDAKEGAERCHAVSEGRTCHHPPEVPKGSQRRGQL